MSVLALDCTGLLPTLWGKSTTWLPAAALAEPARTAVLLPASTWHAALCCWYAHIAAKLHRRAHLRQLMYFEGHVLP